MALWPTSLSSSPLLRGKGREEKRSIALCPLQGKALVCLLLRGSMVCTCSLPCRYSSEVAVLLAPLLFPGTWQCLRRTPGSPQQPLLPGGSAHLHCNLCPEAQEPGQLATSGGISAVCKEPLASRAGAAHSLSLCLL